MTSLDLIKVAFVQDFFAEYNSEPTDCEIQYVAGVFDKLAENAVHTAHSELFGPCNQASYFQYQNDFSSMVPSLNVKVASHLTDDIVYDGFYKLSAAMYPGLNKEAWGGALLRGGLNILKNNWGKGSGAAKNYFTTGAGKGVGSTASKGWDATKGYYNKATGYYNNSPKAKFIGNNVVLPTATMMGVSKAMQYFSGDGEQQPQQVDPQTQQYNEYMSRQQRPLGNMV